MKIRMKSIRVSLILALAAGMFWSLSLWADPSVQITDHKEIAPIQGSHQDIRPLQPSLGCKDPGDPTGFPVLYTSIIRAIGYDHSTEQFGYWQHGQFVPITQYRGHKEGIDPYNVLGTLKVVIYARVCVKQVEVHATTSTISNPVIVDPHSSIHRASDYGEGRQDQQAIQVEIPIQVIDTQAAKRWCNTMDPKPETSLPVDPPVMTYYLPGAVNTKSIMSIGAPYTHEKFYGVSIELQCWAEKK